MEEGDKSHSPPLPEDSKHNEYSERLAENVEGFKQFMDEIFEVLDKDEKFDEMTAENYDNKKSYMRSHLLELSSIHNSLADHHAKLIEKISKNCPSLIRNQNLESSYSTSFQGIQMLAPKVTSGFDAFCYPVGSRFSLSSLESPMPSANKPSAPPVIHDALKGIESRDPGCGGFNLSKSEGPSYSGSELSMTSINKPRVTPVKDDSLKVKESRNPGYGRFDLYKGQVSSYSGSESRILSVNKPEVPQDDELQVKETKDSGFESSILSVNKPAVPPDDALQVKETKDSDSESSISSVSDDAMNVEETKDSGSESSISSVSDDAMNVEETKDSDPEFKALLEKISTLEEEAVSLKEKIQSLTVENGELKLEIDENIADVSLYMSGTKLEMKTKEEELEAMEDIAMKLDENMSTVLEQKKANQSKHVSKIKEMKMQMKQYMTEISQLKSTHEKKEKIWNGVLGQLKNDLKDKSELFDETRKRVNTKDDELTILWDEKHSRNTLIEQLKTELNSVKSENLGVLPSFDNVQKLTDELKQKLMELESEVDKQKKAIPNRK